MAKASEQFRQSDVALWGIVALICGALAVFGANVSALMPQGILAGLHKTRIDGASIDQLRLDVAGLNDDLVQLRRENNTLVTQFTLQEQAGNQVVQRVGALEVSLPKLLEALPQTAEIDRSSLTGSIGDGKTMTYEADGGSVAIRQQPMALSLPPIEQPVPQALTSASGLAQPDASVFGIAVGPGVTLDNASAAWTDLSVKFGPLLFGLSPLLAAEAGGDAKRIVLGPISQLSEATALCARLERVSVACMPMPFSGTPLKP